MVGIVVSRYEMVGLTLSVETGRLSWMFTYMINGNLWVFPCRLILKALGGGPHATQEPSLTTEPYSERTPYLCAPTFPSISTHRFYILCKIWSTPWCRDTDLRFHKSTQCQHPTVNPSSVSRVWQTLAWDSHLWGGKYYKGFLYCLRILHFHILCFDEVHPPLRMVYLFRVGRAWEKGAQK